MLMLVHKLLHPFGTACWHKTNEEKLPRHGPFYKERPVKGIPQEQCCHCGGKRIERGGYGL
jgi:hypothetical protein